MSIAFHTPGFVAPSAAWLFGHRAAGRHRMMVVVALVIATACLAGAAWTWSAARAELEARLRGRAASEQALRLAAVAPPASVPAVSAAERVRINRIVRRLNMPWGPIFSSLEGQAMPTVAVLSLEPDVERGAVRVQTEGPSLDELLQHATRVQQAPYFGRAQLLRIDPHDAKSSSELSRLSFDLVLVR